MEVVVREEELTDFVSTAKGVMQSLVEKHFPAPDRNKINKLLGIGASQEKKSIFEELDIDLNSASASSENSFMLRPLAMMMLSHLRTRITKMM